VPDGNDPSGQLKEHADAPGGEYVPAQHRHVSVDRQRHVSVDRHEVVRVAVTIRCSLLQDAMLACSISPRPLPLMHTL
jgi:hypothetical protein